MPDRPGRGGRVELVAVSDAVPAKLDRYGEAFLKAIREGEKKA